MPSDALTAWREVGLARLDELEGIHRQATGTRPGRRWGTRELNRSLFIALVAQFQTYCRALHDAAVETHVVAANPEQAELLRRLLRGGRALDRMTPRTDALGIDFGRLGFRIVETIRARSRQAMEDLRRLDTLVDFRNAIGHGNETAAAALVATGEIRETKASFREYRRAIHRLAIMMDGVVAERLSRMLGVPPPW